MKNLLNMSLGSPTIRLSIQLQRQKMNNVIARGLVVFQSQKQTQSIFLKMTPLKFIIHSFLVLFQISSEKDYNKYCLQMKYCNKPEYIIYDPNAKTYSTHFKAQPYAEYNNYVDHSEITFSKLGQQNKIAQSLAYDTNYEYLVVAPGLNLKGICQTQTPQKCIAEGQQTWIRCGYGQFDIGYCKHNSYCPCCKKKISYKTIKTLGYTRTNIVIEGVKWEGEQVVPYKMEDKQSQGNFIQFKDFEQNVGQWEYISIITRKI